MALPLEIRLMIYELVFTAKEQPQPTTWITNQSHRSSAPTRRTPSLQARPQNIIPSPYPTTTASPLPKRATFHSKLPLLLTSQSLYHETQPLLYHQHIFLFHCGGWQFGSPCDDQLSLINKLNLSNTTHYLPKRGRDLSLRAQLFVLHHYAYNLESLKMDYHLNKDEKGVPGAYLEGFWGRLREIEVRFTQRFRGERGREKVLVAIAGAEEWGRGEVRVVDGRDEDGAVEGMEEYIYSLRRERRRYVGGLIGDGRE